MHVYYNVLNSQNLRSEFTLTTTTIQVCTNFGQSGVTEDCSATPITVVSSISLPDSTSYTLNYDQGTTAGHYGALTSMQLPTGGTVGFTYSNYKDAFNNQNLFLNTYSLGSGTWNFAPLVITSCGTTCSEQVTVSQPSGDHQVYTFSMYSNNMWNTQTVFYQGAVSPSNALQTTTTAYSTTNPPYVQPLTVTTSVPIAGGTTLSKQTQVSYDTNNFGNVVNHSEWGFYIGTPPTTSYRTSAYTYLTNSDNNMVNKKTNISVYAGSSQVASSSIQITYDGTAVSSVTGVVNHDDLNFGTSYLARGNPTSVSTTVTTTAVYDMTGQPTQTTDANSNVTTFNYTNNFFDDSSTGPVPHSTSTLTNAYPKTITLPAPFSWTINLGYYWGTGQPAKKIDQNGQTASLDYMDPFARATQAVLPNGGWKLNQYSSSTSVNSFQSITDTTPSPSCSSCVSNQIGLDTFGRPVTTTLENDPDGNESVVAAYDSSSRMQTITTPYRSMSDPTYGQDTYSYDGLGRVIQVTHSAGGSVHTYYGANVTSAVGGNTSQLCSTTTYGYGYPILGVDEAGKKREVWTDGLGRIIEVDEPNNSGTLNQNTCYTYDVLNNVMGVTQGSQTRSYAYDQLSNLVQATTPESGTVNYYYENPGLTLCSGNPNAACRRVDARNITTTYTYDNLNRLTGITYTGGSPATSPVTYTYDSGTNQKGFRTGMTDGSGSTTWTYNTVGWMLTENRTIAGKLKTISYTYNLDGTLSTIIYPSGRTITYTTSNADRSTSAKDVTNNIQYAVTASYAPIGALSGVIYGPATGFTGITETAAYNSRLETTAISALSSGGTPQNLTFNYGSTTNNGTLTSIQNNVTSGLGESFTYDSLNRIVSGATTSNSVTGCWGQSFGTTGNPPDDRWSNLTQINSTQCSTGTLSVTANSTTNRLSATGYAFDNAGNMTGDATYTYTFDAENHLAQATGMSGGPWNYVYDGNGLRVEKSNASGGTLYWRSITGDAIAESDLSGNIANEYVFFAGQRIAQRTSGNTVFYYYSDQIGSTTAITTQNGTPCYQATFTPYGEEHATETVCSTNYKFTGYERDSETGLDYAFARIYNSRLGRFMSADPLGGDVTDPQSLNRFAYTVNSPTNLIDPFGMDDQIACPPEAPPGTICVMTNQPLPGLGPQPPPGFGGGAGGIGGDCGGAPCPVGNGGGSSSQSPPGCSLSVRQRVSLGIQGGLNAGIGAYKAIKGAVAVLTGLGLAPPTAGSSVPVAVAGAYLATTGTGQAASGLSQLQRAATGNGGPETKFEQRATIASGPIFGLSVLGSGFSMADAERAANFESAFTGGTGLINSPTASELIQNAVDTGLTAMGIADSGGCKQH